MAERIINVGPNDQYYAFKSTTDGEIIYSVGGNGAGIEGKAKEAILKLPNGKLLDPAEQPVSGGPKTKEIDWSKVFSKE